MKKKLKQTEAVIETETQTKKQTEKQVEKQSDIQMFQKAPAKTKCTELELKVDELNRKISNLEKTVYTLDKIIDTSFRPEIVVYFKKLKENAVIPTYSSKFSAGMDLTAIGMEYDQSTNTYCYHTGLAVEMPSNCVGLLFPKSSVYKKTMSLANCVGVIDADYRGEIMLRFKKDSEHYEIEKCNKRIFPFLFGHLKTREYEVGEKIAQLVIVRIPKTYILESKELSKTDRGENGFGQMTEIVKKLNTDE